MKVQMMNLSEIKPYENNPRQNKNAIKPVMESIKAFGFQQPIVVDKDYVIIVGHTRYEASKLLNIVFVPVIVADHLTKKQVKAYRVADNKIAQLATWDPELQKEELEKVAGDIDMSLFGFITDDSQLEGLAGGGMEMSLDDFSDNEFKYECPGCGFKFND